MRAAAAGARPGSRLLPGAWRAARVPGAAARVPAAAMASAGFWAGEEAA